LAHEKTFVNAFVHHKEGRFKKASELYKSLLNINFQKNRPQLLLLLGICEIETNDFLNALKHINSYMEIDSNDHLAFYYSGKVLDKLERYEDSFNSLNIALKLNSDFIDAIILSGVVLGKLGENEKALQYFERALALNQSQEPAHANKGLALKELGRFKESIISFDDALRLNPSNIKVLNSKGIVLHQIGDHEDALKCFNRALEINPDFADAIINKGVQLERLNKFNESILVLNQALSMTDKNAEAYNSLGQSLERVGKYKEALKNFDQAILLNGTPRRYRKNKSLLNLHLKKFEEGWADFDSRLEQDYVHAINFKLDQIFIHNEQGVGDEIFFGSLLNDLSKDFRKIFVKVNPRLIKLFKRSFPQINFVIDDAVDFNNHLFMGSLGKLYRKNLESFKFQRERYLFSDQIKKEGFRYDLKKRFGDKFLCGISWKSSAEKISDFKSFRILDLMPILSLKNIVFINLQYGEISEDINLLYKSQGIKIETIDNLDYFNDIESLASLIDACDFIVSSSNVTAHLAGALGKKTYLLTPFSKGRIWYWHHNDKKSIWYPSVNNYYQSNLESWKDPIENLSKDILKDFSLTTNSGITS
jgi:tetratricopeptide (TPR) repeat protein